MNYNPFIYNYNRYTKLAELKLKIARIQLGILKNKQGSKLKEDQFKQNILEVELEITTFKQKLILRPCLI